MPIYVNWPKDRIKGFRLVLTSNASLKEKSIWLPEYNTSELTSVRECGYSTTLNKDAYVGTLVVTDDELAQFLLEMAKRKGVIKNET